MISSGYEHAADWGQTDWAANYRYNLKTRLKGGFICPGFAQYGFKNYCLQLSSAS